MFKGNVRYTGGRGSHLNRKGTFRLLEPNMYFQTMTLSSEPLHNDCFRKDFPLQHGRASVKRVNSEPGVICWQLWGVFLPNFSKPPSSLSGRVKVKQEIHLKVGRFGLRFSQVPQPTFSKSVGEADQVKLRQFQHLELGLDLQKVFKFVRGPQQEGGRFPAVQKHQHCYPRSLL